MRIPAWRLALTGAALTILAVAGIGLASAGNTATTQRNGAAAGDAPSQAAGGGSAAATVDEAVLDGALDAAPAGLGAPAAASGLRATLGGRFFRRHLVHAVVTLQGRDGALITIQLDHGKVTAVDAKRITLSEAGGSTVTIDLNDDTKVRQGRQRTTLDAIKVGAEVVVQSRVDGGSLAKRIFILPSS